MRALPVAVLFVLAILFACSPQQDQDNKYKIGFAQCTEGDAWRKAMRQEMERELSFYPDISLQIKDSKSSSELQVQQIREFIDQDVDLLIVSPNEAEPVSPIVEEAYEKGIPVIIVDRRTNSSLYTAYVGANNYEIGKLAGSYVADILNGKGNVMEISGLKGSTPAQHRHTGFMDALAQYEEIRIVSEVHGEWEKETAKARVPASYAESPGIDLVFAHNDVMALGAYEYLKSIDKADNLLFVGVDGIGGPGGGLQMVVDGALDATFLYPSGGDEIIRLAHKILNNEPYNKENILQSTVVDARNVHILKQQTNKILQQQENIERQQQKISEQNRLYHNQRLMLYVLLAGMVIIIVLGALTALALREKSELNRTLMAKNTEVISQRNEIAKMARKADKATEAQVKFFTNVSHEFRTPLTLILAPVEDLLKKDIPAEVKKELVLVKKNANRLLRLVNQLMDFRKIENRKMKLQAAERDVLSFIREVTTSFHSLAAKREIIFKVYSKLIVLPLYFDADKLDKVLFNLLSNAFKFTPDGGAITVSVEVSDDFKNAVILVEDTGRGMSAQQQEQAFERFYSGETDSSMGTGLGLALSQEFVKLHRGSIEVVSEKWKGTRFIIMLPLGRDHLKEAELIANAADTFATAIAEALNREEEVDAPLPAEQLVEASRLKEYTLLLVEDNEELRQFLKERLQQDFTVIEAADGHLGLSMAFEAVPDLVVSDIMLPNKSGLELAASLKNDRRTSHIPLILLTARDALEQKIEGIQTGADLYITKPFSYSYLNEQIKGLIRTRELLKVHYSSEPPLDNTNLPAPKQLDRKFISEFVAVVEQNLSSPTLNANHIATSLGLSRVQVYRKVKALLGYSVNDYVINVRLKRAKHLLLHSELNISEIAYEVGFSSPAYFSTTFKNHFNQSPSEFKAAASNA